MFISNNQTTETLSWLAPTLNEDGTTIDYALAYELYIDGEATITFPGTLNPEGKYEFLFEDVPAIASTGVYELALKAFSQDMPERKSDLSGSIIVASVSVPLAPTDLSAD